MTAHDCGLAAKQRVIVEKSPSRKFRAGGAESPLRYARADLSLS